MRVLLDTHVLFWALQGGQRLSRRAVGFIGDVDVDILVSAVSAYEICFKHRLGKMPEAAELAADFEGEMAALKVGWLPISPPHAIAAANLDPSHRDPFDRLLIGQALIEGIAIVSNEVIFDRFGVDRIW